MNLVYLIFMIWVIYRFWKIDSKDGDTDEMSNSKPKE